jgi:hypothetical protein
LREACDNVPVRPLAHFENFPVSCFCLQTFVFGREMSRECLIDFLDPRLSENCEISTDGVSDDHYSLDNLIAADLSKRNLGFMAFQVSKPPIEITIKFKWKIDLKLIKVS